MIIKTFTSRPENVTAYGPVFDASKGRTLPISIRTIIKGGVVANIDGVTDRDTVKKMRGTRLYVPRRSLPPPKAQEYYHCDLIGLTVEDKNGATLGTVVAIYDAGAGNVIEVVSSGNKPPLMLSFTRSLVPCIDIDGGRLIVAQDLI